MKTLLLLLALTAALAAAAPAQQPCTMTKDQLPAMRKLRLGMERAEFEKVYRGASILVMKRHAADPADLEGLDGIAFDFYHDRLYFIEYDYNPKLWKGGKVQDFAKSVSEDLKLPADARIIEPGDFLATMRCADFFVKINSKNPTLTLRDTVADKAKKAEEKVKNASKP
jgi:ABC-type amino acid transport substrate-binding protein